MLTKSYLVKKSDNKPTPISVKKMLLSLIASDILCPKCIVSEDNADSQMTSETTTTKEKYTVKITATLGHSRHSTNPVYALNDNYSWNRIQWK